MDYHLADFLGLDRLTIKHKTILVDIKRILLSKYPFEHGGLVNHNLEIIEYKSTSLDCHNYIPPQEFFISLVRNKHLFSFHSHLNLVEPSENDLFFIRNYNLPIIIYSLNFDLFLGVNKENEKYRLSWNI